MSKNNKSLKEIEKEIKLRSKRIIEIKKNEFSNIKIHLNKENTYREFSNNTLLNENIYSTIEEAFKFTPKVMDYKIYLIFDNSFNNEEKENIKELLKDHYALKTIEHKHTISKTIISSIVCLIIGILLLALYSFLHIHLQYQYSEVLSIFAWVFVWESCDLLFFSNIINRKELIKLELIYSSNIVLLNEGDEINE